MTFIQKQSQKMQNYHYLVVIRWKNQLTILIAPPWLLDVEKGYALYIQNDEISPSLNAGDIAFVEPSLPLRKGDTAITFDQEILPGNSRQEKYLILRLNEYKNGIYSFQTLKDNKELNISEPQYKNIHRITGVNFT